MLAFRGRILLGATAFLAGLALAVVPSLGADQSVTAGGSSTTFDQKTVTVSEGESVTWTNAGGMHNVNFEDGGFTQPPAPDTSPWKVTRTFSAAGTYRYFCQQHGGPGGIGMSGTVVVVPASTTAPPGGGPPGSVHRDTTPPSLTLFVPRVQRIVADRGLVVTVRVNEEATIAASATISLPGASRVFALKKVTRQLAPGVKAKLKLRLPRKARTPVASALAHGRRVKAKLSVVAKDVAGNSRSSKRTIGLRR